MSLPNNSKCVIVWEFRVREGMQQQFERTYGPDGNWARLFASDPAYCRTVLLRNCQQVRTYLTLDFWESEAAFLNFRGNSPEYPVLDSQCEGLTVSEREIGRFLWVAGDSIFA